MLEGWSAFKMPNKLLLDKDLSFSTRILGAALYSRINRLNTCRKSLKELSTLCHRSEGNVETGLKELEKHGYITRQKRSWYHHGRGRMEKTRTVYTCAPITGGFTIVPRSVFQYDLKPSRTLVLLYLYFHTGEREAFPSYTRIARDLHMSRSTATDSTKELGRLGILYIRKCINSNGSYSNNSYFFLQQTTGAAERSPAVKEVHTQQVRRLAIQRLGILLARRWGPLPAGPATFPHIQFWPALEGWKPPFEWG
jgi:DNA-binding MarR family transcriptional regulator